MRLKTIAEVKKANKEAGHHFFSKETMRFFNSRIETTGYLIRDRFFITSEQMDSDTPRYYSVREINPNGTIKPGSKRFDTLKEAKNEARKM